MCDCCKKFGINSTFRNGNKDLFDCRFYDSFGEQTTTITLCRLHSIELFKLGEKKFVGLYGDIRKRLSDLERLAPLGVRDGMKNIELVIG